MPLESWKKEFYSVDASLVPDHKALAHSLRKWEGALRKNRERHGVEWCSVSSYTPPYVADGKDSVIFGASSCALCSCFFCNTHRNGGAEQCPVEVVTGETCVEVYELYSPKEMVKLLKRVKKEVK